MPQPILMPGEKYFRDESNIKTDPASCRVFLPLTSADAAEIISASSSVTFAGGNTGLTGAAVAMTGGDIISTEKFTSIVIDPAGRTAETGAGVTLSSLHKAAAEFNLWYPADSTEQSATIGGNIATNAWGTRSFKYGSVRDFVKSIRVVLAEGEIIDLSRGEHRISGETLVLDTGKRMIRTNIDDISGMFEFKNSAGYYMKKNMDIIDLFCGSEGTLGLITKAVISLEAKPRTVSAVLVESEQRDRIFEFIRTIKDLPAYTKADSLEYIDAGSAALLSEKYPKIKPGYHYAFCEFSSYTEDEDETAMEIAREAALDAGIPDDGIKTSDTGSKDDFVYAIRESLPEIINTIMRQRGMRKIGTDFAVPDRMQSRMTELYDSVLPSCGIKYAVFGHAGNNNLHINFMPESMEQSERALEIYEQLAQGIMKIGGTVSAEHGVGKLKKRFLRGMYGEKAVSAMLRVKQAFDPRGVLCPGNVF